MVLAVIKFTVVEGADPKIFAPIRASGWAVGFDVGAFHVQNPHSEDRKPYQPLPTTINPGESALIGIGIKMAIPPGFQIEVRPRSGLASKLKIQLLNSPGTIDPDFRGEAGVLLHNVSDLPFIVESGMRIAQLVVSKVELPDFVFVPENKLPMTSRGAGGFGSTGLMEIIGDGTEAFDDETLKIDRYFMGIAVSASTLSNCVRGCKQDEDGKYPKDEKGCFIGQTRRYGCVIAMPSSLQVIATGFNRQYPGSELCSEVGCLREQGNILSGANIEICRAIHAEQAAIISLAINNSSINGATMYVTADPCLQCAREIAGLVKGGMEALVVLKGQYSTTEGLKIVQAAGIKVRSISL